MVSLLHRQPFRAVYLTGFLVATLFQLPGWLVYYSWPPNRPRRSWTLQRSVLVRILRNVTKLIFKFSVHDGRDLSLEVSQEELEPLNARFVWIPELEKEDVVGVIAEHATRAGIDSIAIPAYWILKSGVKWSPAHDRAGEGEKVILYVHGGGFVSGTAYPSHRTASIVKGILEHSSSLSRVLSVDYRLSSGPPFESRNPFPAAVVDIIAAYKYLVCKAGFLPQNITIAGDSAGGNLALAATRYVVESRLPYLPPPGGLIASSPIADTSFSRAGITSSHHLNAKSDIFDIRPSTKPVTIEKAVLSAYIGEMDPEEVKHNRYISPASKFVIPPADGEETKLFSGFPRSYIMGGGAEHMFDDIVALAEGMKNDGVDITTDFPPDAVHSYTLFRWHEPERTESLIKCAAWVDGCVE